MIDRKEIREITTSKVSSFLEPLNYIKVKMPSDMLAIFECNDHTHNYRVNLSLIKIHEYKLIYSYEFGIQKIVDLLKEIDKYIPLSKSKYTIKNYITGISPGQLVDPFDIYKAYSFFNSEKQLEKIIDDLKLFYNEKFVPFCIKYSNYKNLDQQFNSFDNFYIKGNGNYPTLTFFHVTRLIIARLANNPEYEKVVEKNFEALEFLWEQDGGKYDRFDETKPEVFAAKYLRDLKI